MSDERRADRIRVLLSMTAVVLIALALIAPA